MNNKEELQNLIETLPDEKIPAAISAILALMNEEDGYSEKSGSGSTDELYQFLKTFVTSVNNALYDLTDESTRQGETILAKKLTFSRKKMLEAWNNYKSTCE